MIKMWISGYSIGFSSNINRITSYIGGLLKD